MYPEFLHAGLDLSLVPLGRGPGIGGTNPCYTEPPMQGTTSCDHEFRRRAVMFFDFSYTSQAIFMYAGVSGGHEGFSRQSGLQLEYMNVWRSYHKPDARPDDLNDCGVQFCAVCACTGGIDYCQDEWLRCGWKCPRVEEWVHRVAAAPATSASAASGASDVPRRAG